MHFKSTLLPLLATAAAAAASALTKRCSPLRDPELQMGYLPPAPCWQDFDTACRPFIQEGTELAISESRGTVIVFGVSEYCFGIIAEEIARSKDGRKIYGWEKTHGKLIRVGKDILAITEMSSEALKRYQALKYKKGSPDY